MVDPDALSELQERLWRPLREIPTRYLYDNVGSALFEEITRLPEYYQTRTEIALLEAHAAEVIEAVDPRRIAELGSGAGRKIRLVLDALGQRAAQVAMLDINALFLEQSLAVLSRDYPHLDLRGIEGDFLHELDRLGPGGRRLILFFAGTIGNLPPAELPAFFTALRAQMAPQDALLVGVDLVKDPARLEAAYDDSQGVTARFGLNILDVVNRACGTDFDKTAFRHVAFWDADGQWIDIRVESLRAQRVQVGERVLELAKGEQIRTEISCKFTRETMGAHAAAGGLVIDRWLTDPEQLFALALMRPA